MYYKTRGDKIPHLDSKKEAERLYKEHLIAEKKERDRLLRKKRKRAELCIIFRLHFETLLGNRLKKEEERREKRKERRKKKKVK